MNSYEAVFFATAVLYALACLGFILAAALRNKRALSLAFIVACAGLALHTLAIALRWIAVGYGPYIGFFDAVSSYAFLVVAVYVALVAWKRGLASLGLVVLPIAFILLAVALTTSPTEMGITPALASIWLVVHVIFAASAITAMLISFVFAVVFLIRARKDDLDLFAHLPQQQRLEMFMFQAMSVGFILWTVMIIIGAIWANEAWGRYWGWDPIETWSLIAWIVYAICLHLRLTRGWKGTRFAYLTVVALPIMLFALIGVPFVWDSIHAAYLAVE